MTVGELIAPQEVDLTNCDREAIHIPGFIQPHGVLFVLEEPELKVLQLSNNTFKVLGVPPEELRDRNLGELIDADQIAILKNCLIQPDLTVINPIEINITNRGKSKVFDGIVHRSKSGLILELEPTIEDKNASFYNFYHLVKSAISILQNAVNIQDVCEILAKEVRKINGFDRVMVYRFDRDGSGFVTAEDKQEELPPYLGLHYPASDIPKQARKLYSQNWLRLIVDVNYQPAEIVPALHPTTNNPLDLSHSVLRSVSPIHVEYLQNMGVTASMSISLMKNKELWGLIACHHYSPKYVPSEIRTACQFLGQMASLELVSKEDNEGSQYTIDVKSIQAKLIEYMSGEERFIDGLIKHEPNLLDLVNAGGAAICFDGSYWTVGNTPEPKEIKKICEIIDRHCEKEIFYTESLAKYYQEAEKIKDVASGLLALSISKSQRNYIIWFRPEVIQSVNWAGNPNKPVEVDNEGSVRLSPRKSFELWKETVSLKSFPWKQCEIDAALEIRNAIVGAILKKADELAKLNIELERKNKELDAFAYIASHDLKEPLRGIHNYSSFLLEDYITTLDEEGVSKLETLVRLTQRMENLIDSLLNFSRVGRVDFTMEEVDLNALLNETLEMLSARIEENQVSIRIPKKLPVILCDRVQIGEVFGNLISNAIKYNEKSEKWVDIGFLDNLEPPGNQPLIFYVRDNGIGIRDKHFEAIFRIFKRLHGPGKYGGGTGAGLTIVKKIIERHNGKIWVESTYGQGATFYFTLHN